MARTARKKVAILDEGITLTDDVDSLDFAGSGVSGAAVNRNVTETIPGGFESPLTFNSPLSRSVNTISLTTVPVTLGGTGTSTAFTIGSVIFAGASGVYSQDNANLFWDDTNNRLMIGTNSVGPNSSRVTINGSLETTNGGAFLADGEFYIGNSSGSSAVTNPFRLDGYQDNLYYINAVSDVAGKGNIIFRAGGETDRMIITGTGKVAIGDGAQTIADDFDIREVVLSDYSKDVGGYKNIAYFGSSEDSGSGNLGLAIGFSDNGSGIYGLEIQGTQIGLSVENIVLQKSGGFLGVGVAIPEYELHVKNNVSSGSGWPQILMENPNDYFAGFGIKNSFGRWNISMLSGVTYNGKLAFNFNGNAGYPLSMEANSNIGLHWTTDTSAVALSPVAIDGGATIGSGYYQTVAPTNGLIVQGKVGLGGVTSPSAYLHLGAGTTAANTAPIKLNSGTSMTAAEAGAMEFTTDDLFFTITTGVARKRILMADPVGGLTSGRVALVTTNGRLTDDADLTFSGSTTTMTDAIVGTSLKIPTGSAPTVDAAGELAHDTTDEQLLLGDAGNAAFVVNAKKKSISFVLDTPTATDVFPICQVPYGITITKIWATAKGGTSSTFNIEERSATTLNSAGTDVMTADLAADADGASTTTFTNPGIAANAFLVFAASALSGTVDQIVIEIDYTIDRT